jgi:hypothetical protein
VKDNLKKTKELPCSVCGIKPPSDPHHYKTRGAGGDDSLENLISLCRKHHNEIHQIGVLTFMAKYGRGIEKFRTLYGLPKLKSLKSK